MTTPLDPTKVEELRAEYRRAVRELGVALVNEENAWLSFRILSLVGGRESQTAEGLWRAALGARERAARHVEKCGRELSDAVARGGRPFVWPTGGNHG